MHRSHSQTCEETTPSRVDRQLLVLLNINVEQSEQIHMASLDCSIKFLLLFYLASLLEMALKRYSIWLLNFTLLFASLAFCCWFVWFSLVGVFGTLFIRLYNSLPSTVRVGGSIVAAALLSKSSKTLHRPVRFSGFKSFRIFCFCN